MVLDVEEMTLVSMKMIANAGDGRDCIQRALISLNEGNYEETDNLLREADDLICKAHVAQTEVLQKTLESETEEGARILFTHAQDTLMTINSEYYLAKQMITLVKSLNEKIEKLGERLNENNL